MTLYKWIVNNIIKYWDLMHIMTFLSVKLNLFSNKVVKLCNNSLIMAYYYNLMINALKLEFSR